MIVGDFALPDWISTWSIRWEHLPFTSSALRLQQLYISSWHFVTFRDISWHFGSSEFQAARSKRKTAAVPEEWLKSGWVFPQRGMVLAMNIDTLTLIHTLLVPRDLLVIFFAGKLRVGWKLRLYQMSKDFGISEYRHYPRFNTITYYHSII